MMPYHLFIIIFIIFSGRFNALSNELIGKSGSEGDVNRLLLSAATRGNLTEVKALIKKGADINVKGVFDTTPLLAASSTIEDQPLLVDYLIKNGAEINCFNELHETPLHLAVKYQRLETVKVLLSYQADPNIRDKEGKTPLDYAMLEGNTELMSLFTSRPAENLLEPYEKKPPEQTVKKINGLCYQPSVAVFSPDRIKKDITRLKCVTEKIRTFHSRTSSWLHSQDLMDAGMKVYAGCDIGYNKKKNEEEIKSIIDVAGALPIHSIESLVIGNEVLSQEKITVKDLIEYIDNVKEATSLPVSTSETFDYWIKYPELSNSVDYIFLIVHPFWEGVEISSASDYVLQKVNRLKTIYPDSKIIISETGWPAYGPGRGKAVPGHSNQARFFEEFTRMAEKHKLEYFYFKGFDTYDGSIAPKQLNSNWGIFDINGRTKEQMEKALTNKTSFGFINSVQMEFVFIHPDSFMMGGNIKGRFHKVTFSEGFYIQTTEVTRKQWVQVMKKNTGHVENRQSNYPVVNISWNDCMEFITLLNDSEKTNRYRLPTEAEWEFACRSGSTGKLPWHDEIKTCQYANIADLSTANNLFGNRPFQCRDGFVYSAPVASFKPNEFGLYDMIGNVWEWCHDFLGPYPSSEVTDPKGPEKGTVRVIRGGGWDSSGDMANSSYRGKGRPDKTGKGLGFRLVYEVSH